MEKVKMRIGRREWSMRSVWMVRDWIERQSSNIWSLFCMNQVQMMPSGRKVAGFIRFLVNARDLQLDCVRVMLEGLLVPVQMYGSETDMKKRSRIRAVWRIGRLS